MVEGKICQRTKDVSGLHKEKQAYCSLPGAEWIKLKTANELTSIFIKTQRNQALQWLYSLLFQLEGKLFQNCYLLCVHGLAISEKLIVHLRSTETDETLSQILGQSLPKTLCCRGNKPSETCLCFEKSDQICSLIVSMQHSFVLFCFDRSNWSGKTQGKTGNS